MTSDGLFSWVDGEVRWLSGETGSSEGRTASSCPVLFRSMAAAAFLSGWSSPSIILVSDEDGVLRRGSFCFRGGRLCLSNHLAGPRVVVGGSVCASPEDMRSVCDLWPAATMYACPVIDELPSLGSVVCQMSDARKAKPVRLKMDEPMTVMLDAERKPVDDEGDALGRAAHLVSIGMPVVVRTRVMPGRSWFHGRVLSRQFSPSSVCLVRDDASRSFPDLPVSALTGAATTVPVMATPSDEFRKKTGWEEGMIPVMVTSEAVPGSVTFMRFCKVMAGMDFVASTDVKKAFLTEKVPLFHYNMGYKVPRERMHDALGVLRQCERER